MFSVVFVIPQAELTLFIKAFPLLTRLDGIFFMLCGFFPLLVTIPLLMRYFQNKNAAFETAKINWKVTLPKLGIIGIIFCCVYYIFGYLISWQFEEVRVFYSGLGDAPPQFHKYSLLLFPVQILKGILFGACVIPIKSMVHKSRTAFIIGVCLVYLSVGLMLLSPNALFPDTVRYANLIEMLISMLLFGIIVGYMMWGEKLRLWKPSKNVPPKIVIIT
jgi:hypothetical protein